MKSFLKKIILCLLEALVRHKLKKTKPTVIGVTGSVGKTSAKDAIHKVLKSQGPVYHTRKSYNTEFGLLLAILEQESGFSSPLKWLKSLLGAFRNAYFPRKVYPKLVLEFGADKPGDIQYLVNLVKPQIAVITRIADIHLENDQFSNKSAIWLEKSKLLTALPPDGWAVLNYDDPFQQKLKPTQTPFKKLYYGLAKEADLYADKIESGEFGLKFRVNYRKPLSSSTDSAQRKSDRGSAAAEAATAEAATATAKKSATEALESTLAEVPILGEHHLSILLPAIACGLINHLSLEEAAQALSHFQLPPGRLNLIEGINNSKIIDSSYNASPEAVKAALKVLKSINGKRSIAVLGNMNELGSNSEKLHREIGALVPQYADILITVGERAKWIAQTARKHGLKEIHSFMHAKEAAQFLKPKLQADDVVLVKGSQNLVRLEICVKEIMEYPEKARNLLVRQEKEWRKI